MSFEKYKPGYRDKGRGVKIGRKHINVRSAESRALGISSPRFVSLWFEPDTGNIGLEFHAERVPGCLAVFVRRCQILVNAARFIRLHNIASGLYAARWDNALGIVVLSRSEPQPP